MRTLFIVLFCCLMQHVCFAQANFYRDVVYKVDQVYLDSLRLDIQLGEVFLEERFFFGVDGTYWHETGPSFREKGFFEETASDSISVFDDGYNLSEIGFKILAAECNVLVIRMPTILYLPEEDRYHELTLTYRLLAEEQ